MEIQSVTIKNKTGLHARPAMMFVKAASKYKSEITIKKEGITASSKSLVNILALGLSKDSEITITADGLDEKEAVKNLVDLINSKFGEE